MNILIINLTRMGDLIQTIGLINTVQKVFPDSKIDILVMKAFAPIVNHFNHINEVITLDDEILNSNMKDDIWNAGTELFKVIQRLNGAGYDILFNPIISRQSALLTNLITAKRKLGMQITEKREQKMTCDFTAYLLSNQHNLGDFSYNLVDIFAGMVKEVTQTHFLPDFSDFTLNVFDKDLHSISGFTKKAKGLNKKVIGFHIGASQSNKAWSITQYHNTIKQLLMEGEHCIVLFGGYKEKDFKDYFNDLNCELFINTIGDFKLHELIAAISTVDLFVTNDTGPMHIATALKIPVIDISLGPVSKWETGAYSDNATIVEARLDCHPCAFKYDCPHWDCHRMISPDVVIDLIKNRKPNNKNVRIFKTVKDVFGFHSLRPMFKEDLSQKEYLFYVKRFIWSLFFTNKFENSQDLLTKYFSEIKNDYIIQKYNFDEYKILIKELAALITMIVKELKVVKFDNNQSNVTKSLLKIKKTKEMLLQKAQQFEYIYDWFWFFILKETEIDDYNVKEIAKKTINLYEKLLTKLVILNDLLIENG